MSANTAGARVNPQDARGGAAAGGRRAPGTRVEQPDPGQLRRRRIDWTWRHGRVLGPVNAGVGLVGAGMVADLGGVHPAWGALAGAAAAAGVAVQAASRQISPLGLAYRATCWAGAGAWATWALATSAWSPDVLAAATAGTLLAGLAAPEMADHESRVGARRAKDAETAARENAREQAAQQRIEIALEWEARLARVCKIVGAQVEQIETWPESTGYTLQIRMPKGGANWKVIHTSAEYLAADADLPFGCGVEAGPGASRGVALVRVAIVDSTAEARPYPSDYTTLTINAAHAIGMERSSRLAQIELLEDPALIIGRRGSGKTNSIQVINGNLVRCEDVVLWHIDLNGAGMSLPWLGPWLDGTAERPVLDWVASTEDEALLMVRTAVKMAKARKSIYQQRMAAANDDKIPVDAQVPAVVIVLDEGAEAMASNRGNKELATELEKLISVARAARFQEVVSGLRATAEIIPPAIKAQAGTRIFMRPDDPHEAAQLLGWTSARGISLEDAPHPGSGLMTRAGVPGITPYRSYRLRPAQIRDMAISCQDRRPMLDLPTARVGGDAYARRWDRYRADQARLAAHQDTTGGTPMTATPNTPNNDPQDRAQGVAGLGGAAGDMQASLDRLREIKDRAEQRKGVEQRKDFDTAFAAIVDAEWGDNSTGDGGATGPQQQDAEPERENPQQRMLSILRAAGTTGMHWETLQAALAKIGIKTSKATLYRWLGAAKGDGDVAQVEGQDGYWAATEGR